MLYLVHRTNNSNNTVFRYLKDLQKYLENEKFDTSIIALKVKDIKSSNLALDLFYKNLNYFKFFFNLTYFVLFKLNKKDKVIITTDPPYFYVLIYFLSSFKKINLTIWWQDIFPETFTNNKFIIIFFNFFRSKIINKSKNIFISPDQYDYIKKLNTGSFNYNIIPNWSFYNFSIKNKEIIKPIKLAYLGNISISHNIIKLINNFSTLNNNFEFYISYKERYKRFFQTISKDKRFKLISHLPNKDFLNLLEKIDICVVSEKKDQNRYLFPSKVITYINNGKYVLYQGNNNSYLHNILKKYKRFFFIDTNKNFIDKDFLTIEKKANENISANIINEFNKEFLLKKIYKYIK